MANKPLEILRDGPLKASIWENLGETGTFYSVTFSRIYQDEGGKYHDSNSFSGSEVLRIGHLSTRAYDRVQELYRELKSERS